MVIQAFIKAFIINTLFLILIFFSIEVFNQPEPKPILKDIMPAVIIDEIRIKKTVEQPVVKQNLKLQKQNLEKKIISAEKLLNKTENRKQREQDILNKILEQKTIEAKQLAKERKQAEQLIASLKAKKKLAEERKKAKELADLEAEKKLAEERKLAEEILNLKPTPKIEKAEPIAKKVSEASISNEKIKEITGLLDSKITQHWERPPGFYGGLSCAIKITFQIGGIVENVEIITSSNNIVFDHSAVSAIKKASPLPIPDELFIEFQEILFNFTPSN